MQHTHCMANTVETTNMADAARRILAGQKATCLVRAENMAEARRLLAGLSPRLRALITLKEVR